MARKKKIPDRVKLASALLTIVRPDATGRLVPVIGYEESKALTADQIISRFDFDHGVHEVIGGPTEPWNLTPRPKPEHIEKTAAVDIPQIAKTKRIEKSTAEHRDAMAIKAGQAEELPARAVRRGPKLRSRGFDRPDRSHKIPRFRPC